MHDRIRFAAQVGAATLAIELLTLGLRFGGGLSSSQSTSFLAPWTGGVRIHHGYIGLLVIALAFALPARLTRPAMVIGAALVLSDAVHHAFVLHGFDVFYPGYG